MSKVGRNDPCPCGSAKKYKKCHLGEYDNDVLLAKALPKFELVGCWISDSYDLIGLSPVLIVRKNSNSGKLVITSFLCDLFCLGVKDVIFETHANIDRLDTILDNQRQKMNIIDYETARKIILGVVKFAEEIGFAPHPTYSTAKYIIEPDMPFEYKKKEFGRSGKPFYYTGPNDNYRKIFATLEQNVGKGKFDYEIDERSGYVYSN